MCGIAGFVEYPGFGLPGNTTPEARLTNMLGRIRHRGPDDWGVAFFGHERPPGGELSSHVTWLPARSVRLALGHRRLSILDLTAAGRQPMVTADGRLALVFNGEIYNYLELREELGGFYTFETRTDTEVLLAAFLRWGTDMLGRLDGMYAFAIWDAASEEILCARDPLGIKPFYYADADGCFVFGSEPRAVLAGLETPGHIDECHLGEFLVLGVTDHDEGTFYREVKQLPGAHWMVVRGAEGKPQPVRFWHPVDHPEADTSEIPSKLAGIVTSVVRRQLRADVPLGSCLSGGLDSGTIVSAASSVLGKDIRSYSALTLSSPGFDDDESKWASLTAARAGCKWVPVVPVAADLNRDVEEMAEAMEEPFSGLSIFAQYKVMQRAAERGLKVMLDGQGGDEVFVGYPRMAQQAIVEHLRNGRFHSAVRELTGLRRNLRQPLWGSIMGSVFFRRPRLATARNRRRVAGLIGPGVLSAVRREVSEELYAPRSFWEKQVAELTTYCLPRLLRFEDRNSMAFGVEARVPLLATELVEFGVNLPLHWKVRTGRTKYALRMASAGRLPDEVVWSNVKRGFDVPEAAWVERLRPAIRSWVGDLDYDAPVRGEAILAAIDGGHGGEQWLWRVISTVLWLRLSGARA